MRTFLYLLLAAVLLALGACNRRDARLTAASDVMYTAPDSALAILRHIDPSDISGAGNRALYALLLSQAMSKYHIPPATDSIADIAVAYYDRRGADSLRMLAHFYRAVALDAIGNKGEALTEALLTNELAKEQGATYWQARAHELLGDIYYENHNTEASIRHNYAARDLFDSTGYRVNSVYGLIAVALAQEYNDSSQLALTTLDSIQLIYYNVTDSYLKGLIEFSRIRPLNDLGRPREALGCARSALSYWDNDSAEIIWADVVRSYLMIDSLDAAKSHLARLNISDNPEIEGINTFIKYDYYKKINQPDSALKYLSDYRSHLGKMMDRLLSNNFAFHERDFYNRYYAENQKIADRRVSVTIWLSLLALLIIASISIYIYYRQRVKRDHLNDLIISLKDDLQSEIDHRNVLDEELKTQTSLNQQLTATIGNNTKAADKTIDDLKEQLATLKKYSDITSDSTQIIWEHLRILNEICKAYFDCPESEAGQLQSLFESTLKELRNHKFIERLQTYLNATQDNIVELFTTSVPDLTQEDIDLFCLHAAKFSSKTISLILGIKPGYYYNKCSRLRAKISKIESAYCDIFNDILRKTRYNR